jgi:cytoskeletal protein CcmA (bactofilin family)
VLRRRFVLREPQLVRRNIRCGEEFGMETRFAGWRRLVVGVPEAEAVPARPEAEAVPSEPAVAVIARGMEMNGRLVVPQSLRIDGEFRGELESAASVFVSESGAVEAPIRARAVEIRGAVVGDIVATREIVLHATGRLHGDVETPSLVIARGATFNGRTKMYRPERAVRSQAEAGPATQPESHA